MKWFIKHREAEDSRKNLGETKKIVEQELQKLRESLAARKESASASD